MRKLNRKQKWYLVCGFVVCLRILKSIVIGNYTTKIPEIFQVFFGFVSLTVKIILQYFKFCQQLSSRASACHRQYLELHMYAMTGGTCMRSTFVHIRDNIIQVHWSLE